MNDLLLFARWALLVAISFSATTRSVAATTIDGSARYAYGANIGWFDWRGDANNGAVIGEYVCSGCIYSANVGWINLGSGAPADGIYYQNLASTDFGVNQDGLGNLRGYAWGQNIGWIAFEGNGAPKVDLLTGQFTGYAWSANCGWISLSNATAYVQTDSIQEGSLATNGLPTAWLLQNFGTTAVNPNADPDSDGASNAQEYLAGTNPNDANSNLRITSATYAPGGTLTTLTWNTAPTRYYYIQKELKLNLSWVDSGIGLISSTGPTTSLTFSDTNAPIHFFRIQAVRPLIP